jgi:hypothetical protein
MSVTPDILSASVRGIRYPLTVENGNLATSTDYALVSQQIRSILECRYYERVMRATYGIDDFVLEVMDPSQVNSSIQYSIKQNVSGLTSLNVTGDWGTSGEDGLYRVFIEYGVNGVPQPPLQFALAN